MLSFGVSKEELLARDVCSRLTKAMTDNSEKGEEVAVKSADRILERVRHQMKNESLIKAIKAELIKCHPNRAWTFKENN